MGRSFGRYIIPNKRVEGHLEVRKLWLGRERGGKGLRMGECEGSEGLGSEREGVRNYGTQCLFRGCSEGHEGCAGVYHNNGY